jgi:hypothetical protein
MRAKVLRRVGHVPSPTPMIAVVGDSTSVTLKLGGTRDILAPCFAAITPAVSHPAVPPPTTTIFLTGRTMREFRFGSYIRKRTPSAYLRP